MYPILRDIHLISQFFFVYTGADPIDERGTPA